MKNLVLIALIFLSSKFYCQEMKTDWANISRYSKENRNLLIPAKNENRVVFMGNSITEGWKTNDPDFFSKNNYVNRGIGGQTTSQMLVRFRPDVISLKPKLVVILAGINDIAQNNGPIELQDIFGNIISMVELAKANDIKVILSSILPANDFPWKKGMEPAEKVIQLNSMLEKYASENKILFVNYYPKMVDSEKGLDKKYTNDGVHPTLAGYKVMEPILQEAILKALK
jgi:lysophospholipase L1-like esterase